MPDRRPAATRSPRRATRPAGPPVRDTSTCRCANGRPYPIVTYRDGDLAAVTIAHWRDRDGCWMPTTDVDPKVWAAR